MSEPRSPGLPDLDDAQRSVAEYLKASSAPPDVVEAFQNLALSSGDSADRYRKPDADEVVVRALGECVVRPVEKPDLCIGSHGTCHRLFEGENLFALVHLMERYRARIDVVCIDPPYNTGMENLGYRDFSQTRFSCSRRHRPWLAFMSDRLCLTHELLSPVGVVFLHVDENEVANTIQLCKCIFGESNVDVLVWPKTDPRFDQNRVEKPFKNIKMVHEYVIVCYRDRGGVSLNKMHRPTLVDGRWTDVAVEMESIVGGWGTTSSAKDEVGNIFGDRYRFQTPKPMRLIKEFVRAASNRTSIVLDFFAGSGTTGHAVMDLNQEDGGRRSFILANNNENGICRKITHERLRHAVHQNHYDVHMRYYEVRLEKPTLPRRQR